jgi:hypothetical protein
MKSLKQVIDHGRGRRLQLLALGWRLQGDVWTLGPWRLTDAQVDRVGGERWRRTLQKRADGEP